MAKGFLAGILMGGVVAVAGAGAMSVLLGPPTPPAPQPMPDSAAPAALPDPDSAMSEPTPDMARDDAANVPDMDRTPTNLPDGADMTDAAPMDAPQTLDSARPDVATGLDPLPEAQPGLGLLPDLPAPEDTAPAAIARPPVTTAAPSPDTLPDTDEAPAAVPEAPANDAADPVTAQTDAVDPAPAAPVTRLPQIGVDPDPAPEPEEVAEPGDVIPEDAPPLVRYAAEAEVAPDLPRVAIILIDNGDGPLGPGALQGFPFPVSFAIGPSHPDPQGAMTLYRDLGFEVLALAGVPENAAPRDIEVALQAALQAVPEAVAVIEDPASGLQASRDMSAQVTEALLRSGHGLVMLPKGLNTAQQLAARDGVPSVSLFRDFDSEGQAPAVIRRFLDQAAFKARQEGAVTMLGRVRADTISALVQWGLQDRASSVALVPVSVVLREGAGG